MSALDYYTDPEYRAVLPAQHYSNIMDVWNLLLGNHWHYGLFTAQEQTLNDATKNLTQKMALACAPKPGGLVLDIGCGLGKTAEYFARTYGCRVIGISNSAACIEETQTRTQDLPCASLLDFQIVDAENMTWPNASFDCIFSLESSHLIPNKADLISDCARLLKPGGRFSICDIALKRPLSTQEVMASRNVFLLLAQVFGRARMETPDFYVQQCHSNGMNHISCQDISFQTRPTFSAWRTNGEVYRAKCIELIGEKYCADFLLACDYLESFWDRGVLGYFMLSATKSC